MNIAKLIYDAFPFSSDLDIDPLTDLKDLDTLYKAVISKPVAELGDGLFRFIVVEIMEGAELVGIMEGAELSDGVISKQRAIDVMERAIADIQCIVDALNKLDKEHHR